MDALLTDHLITTVIFLPAAGAALLLLFPRSASAAARSAWLELSAISCSSASEMGPGRGVAARRRRAEEPFSARLDQGVGSEVEAARKRWG